MSGECEGRGAGVRGLFQLGSADPAFLSLRLRSRPWSPTLVVMRWLSCTALFAALSVTALAADLELVRVWPQWNNGDAFDRIGEYFGAQENSGRETVLRTSPTERAGLYFLTRIKADAPVPNAKAVIDLIRPGSPDPQRYTFSLHIPARNHVFHLGLTGADWPGGPDVHPVAWKLTVLDPEGKPLAAKSSFLWEQPAK